MQHCNNFTEQKQQRKKEIVENLLFCVCDTFQKCFLQEWDLILIFHTQILKLFKLLNNNHTKW